MYVVCVCGVYVVCVYSMYVVCGECGMYVVCVCVCANAKLETVTLKSYFYILCFDNLCCTTVELCFLQTP